MRSAALAIALRGLAVLALVEVAGSGMARAFDALRPAWIIGVAAAELLTYPAYVFAYASLTRFDDRTRLSLRALSRVVLAGFGPLAISGGFAVDARAWRAVDGPRASAVRPARCMAILEWSVLAIGAWLTASILLARGPSVPATLLWPWVLGVPAGVACIWGMCSPAVSRWLRQSKGRAALLLSAVRDTALSMTAATGHLSRLASVSACLCIYWAAEVGAFAAAIRAAGLDLGIGAVVIAYATGYLVSRRSLPLGGAGMAEGLLVYSLYELHAPIGPAIAAVLIYRLFNFVLVIVPALLAYNGLEASLDGAEEAAESRVERSYR